MRAIGKKHNNIRIRQAQAPISPIKLIERYALNKNDVSLIDKARKDIGNIITGSDKRLIVIIGPCSVHDSKAAFEYAQKLKEVQQKLKQQLLIVMRVYFEKPRTTIGWKGLIYDPDLNQSFNMDKGLTQARRLLLEITRLGLPTATEYLDLITPQYFTDLISWGAIGARTTESQTHRELASGLSCPVGFKNATNGDVQIAIDAIVSASYSHMFWSISKKGLLRRYQTMGNSNCHIILRGGKQPNYSSSHVISACARLKKNNLPERLMIDCSHGNSQKQFKNQIKVADNIAQQIKSGSKNILGIMVESYLIEGSQPINTLDKLIYGKSITDACLGWDDSVAILETLAAAVNQSME